MTISIIIPAYNVDKYIDECLESCCRQDILISEYEIIIVNDGSVDKTLELAERWASSHENIRLISQVNKGLSEARNTGIEAACGEYLMFVDSDDTISDNILGRLVAEIHRHQPDIIRFCAADMTGNGLKRRFSYREDQIVSTGKELLGTEFQVCVPFSIYKKSFLESHNLRFYPKIFHEDNVFTPMAYYYASKICSLNDVFYKVRQTPDSITRSSNPKKSHDMLKIIDLLENFVLENVEDKYHKHFDKLMADCINSCFRNMNTVSPHDKNELVSIIYDRRSIFRHFINSLSLSHRIEGILLMLFPRHMLYIFTILDRLRSRISN